MRFNSTRLSTQLQLLHQTPLAMFVRVVVWALLLKTVVPSGDEFIFNGFKHANLSLEGIATVTSDGLLRLTNATQQTKGQAFYPLPLHFKPPAPRNATFSFSTAFVFAIVSEFQDSSSFGLTFAVSPSQHPPGYLGKYLGLFNPANNGNSSNHVVAVELDTIQNPEFNDIDDNHVGIDVNSLVSNNSRTAGYFTGNQGFKNLSLISGEAMQVWVEYDAAVMQLNVTIAPTNVTKPGLPLLSSTINLSGIVLDPMFVGFTASEGNIHTSHYILGWSFKMGGKAPALNLSSLPSIPRRIYNNKSKGLDVWLPISASALFLILVLVISYIVMRKNKFAELLEDWEREYGPQRFKYKDLYVATGGFKESELLGAGGFGHVYRGVLPVSKIQIAVKRVSHESRQGMTEFVAEIVSIGQLRHRNLVRLLGYCRRKGELLLVYDFMPNGSLDKYLFDENKPRLNWPQRFQIIKGVASGLLYLHEDWVQVVIHRDIKASNVLLDGEFNGRLGDFGLARLYDHGTDLHTTDVVGTMGYLAPEFVRAGKATKSTDVFSFGVFLLEVACGRRPVESMPNEGQHLIDWVLENWQKGAILEVSDRRLEGVYAVDEMELVLKLALLCCHPLGSARPSMRQVVQFLDGDLPLPELSPAYLNPDIQGLLEDEGFDNYMISYPSSTATASVLSGGR